MVPQDPTNEAGPEAGADLGAMVARARAGDRAVLPQLRAFLDEHPRVWRDAGDLARVAQEAWIGLVAGGDLAAREFLDRQAAALGAELAGPATSGLERLLVDRVVACWLQVHYSDAAAAGCDLSLRQAAFAQQRQDSAHRRYLSAIGALAMVRRLTSMAAEPAHPSPGPEPNAGQSHTAGSLVGPGDSSPLVVFDPPVGAGGPGKPLRRPRREQRSAAL